MRDRFLNARLFCMLNRLKISVKQILRWMQDRRNGLRFARPAAIPTLPDQLSLVQPFLPSSTLSNKIHNIRLAAERIEAVTILPGEVFSFWRIVGKPSAANGFLKGRNIVSGVLSEDVGGGLCQLSGILYHLSLLGGLDVLERYNHTLDLYVNEARYAPLGSDATVVWGHKDLRIRNPHPFPIRFRLQLEPHQLTAFIQCSSPITEHKIHFLTQAVTPKTIVETQNARGEVLTRSVYHLP